MTGTPIPPGPEPDETALLIQADVDGELDAAQSARLATRLQASPEAAAMHARLAALSSALRDQAPRPAAPAALQAAVLAQAGATATPLGRRRTPPWVSFGAGFAMAAAAALLFIIPVRGRPDLGTLDEAVVSSHLRALQPGHLIDVASSDRHTVKPWFDGRLDYAPPVPDLAAAGYPLDGGRLDYVGGRAVAALVYRRRQHPIDLYVWPSAGTAAPAAGSRNGYNTVRWTADGIEAWAVSDLDPSDLANFAARWRAAAGDAGHGRQ